MSTLRSATGSLATQAVEVALPDGALCIAEWTAASATPTGAAVLLHHKDADLDSMRPLARALARVGVSVVNVDLPGHGLSQGDYETDGPTAIEAAARVANRLGAVDLAFVAHGSTVGLLHRADVSPSMGLVSIDPRAVRVSPSSGWQDVPAVIFLDPMDEQLVASVDEMAVHRKAWTLRVTVHSTGRASGETTAVASSTRMANRTIVSISTRFLHEQANYAKRRRPERGGVDDG